MGWIFLAIVLLSIGGGVYYIKYRLRRLSRQIFQTDSLIDGYKKQAVELSETPKSVAGMTRVYLPQITEDFPEFHYGEFKTRAEQMLRSAFQAISVGDVSLLKNASDDLTKSVELTISANESAQKTETYRNVIVHQTEIAQYKKLGGTCTITLQSAVGHLHWISQDGTAISGDKELKEQCKYNIDIVYTQDTNLLTGSEQTAFASSICPNCGAPIETTGAKICTYCGSQVQIVNIRTWKINQFKKL